MSNSKIKRITSVVIIILLVLVPTTHYSEQVFASSNNSETDGTETSSSDKDEEEQDANEEMTSKNDLYFDALNKTQEQKYFLRQVERKDLEKVEQLPASLKFTIYTNVTVPERFGKVEYVKSLVKVGDTVKKGQPVVQIKTSVDEVDLEEKTLQLKRMQQSYRRFISNQNKLLREQKMALDKIEDKQDKEIAKLEYEMAKTNYASSQKSQQIQIANLRDDVNNILYIKNTKTLFAPKDGYVAIVTGVGNGDTIDSTNILVQIVDPSKVMLTVKDTNLQFTYNMKATIEINPTDTDCERTINGKVISTVLDFSPQGENRSYSYIEPDEKLSFNELKDKSIRVTVHVCKMENVLSLPMEAVHFPDLAEFKYSTATVMVLENDGLVQRRVIPGLQCTTDCQIVTGLEEGTKVTINN